MTSRNRALLSVIPTEVEGSRAVYGAQAKTLAENLSPTCSFCAGRRDSRHSLTDTSLSAAAYGASLRASSAGRFCDVR